MTRKNAIITQEDRELLAQAYEESNYPSYACLAREGKGEFTLCSLRAIARVRLGNKRSSDAKSKQESSFERCRTLGELRTLLLGVPDDTPLEGYDIGDPKFVFLVDSEGNAQRIMTENKRFIVFTLGIPVNA